MSSLALQNDIRILKGALEALSVKIPMPTTVNELLKKDFRSLNQSDAYDILSFLINGCFKEKKIITVNKEKWKKVDPESKRTVEQFKNNIIKTIKDLSGEVGREQIPVLKKSQLMLPYCPDFFNCCLGLSSYALSFQLSSVGITFSALTVDGSTIKAEENALQEDKKFFENNNAELLKQIENTRRELRIMNETKKSLNDALRKLIDQCTCLNREQKNQYLGNQCSRDEILLVASNAADELSSKNKKKLQSLKKFDESLTYLHDILANPYERIIIDGKELLASIPYETRNFAEKENINLSDENGFLSLQALFTISQKSLQSCTERRIPVSKNLTEFLNLKLPEYDPSLVSKVELMKDKLDEDITNLTFKLGSNIEVSEMNRWFDDFFPPIGSIEFDLHKSPPVTRKEPIVDPEKIERLIQSKHIEAAKADEISSLLMGSQSNRSGFKKFSGFKRQSPSSTAALGLTSSSLSIAKSGSTSTFKRLRRSSSFSSVDSPLGVRMESTKIWKHTLLRRLSRSSTSLHLNGSPVSTNSPSDSINEHLSSTPTCPEMFFYGDKSISPITVNSLSGLQQQQEYKHESIISNASISFNCTPPWSCSDISASVIDGTRGTFDSTSSVILPELICESTTENTESF